MNHIDTPPLYYALDGHKPVPVASMHEVAEYYGPRSEELHRVAKTTLASGVEVSTVFLAIDHSFGRDVPMLFETIVFGGPLDGEQERYATWNEAQEGHRLMVERCKSAEPPLA